MAASLNAPLEEVGGKAAALVRLVAGGIPVPGFFVVSSAAFELHLDGNKIPWPAGKDHSEAVMGSPVPGPVRQAVLSLYAALAESSGHGVVAVRSSGADEDSGPASFAGQFASVLGVSGDSALLDALKQCWASSLSEDVLAYRRSRNVPAGTRPRFAVVVQAQVFAERAGVLFTRHPLEPDGDLACLEANFGTGESVVGGMVTPDSVTVSRISGEVVESRVGSKRRMTVVSEDEPGSRVVETEPARRGMAVLNEAEAKNLVEMGLKIEHLMGAPQDIEWALDRRGLWILQARPQTGPSR